MANHEVIELDGWQIGGDYAHPLGDEYDTETSLPAINWNDETTAILVEYDPELDNCIEVPYSVLQEILKRVG